jgi:hypothetical protein
MTGKTVSYRLEWGYRHALEELSERLAVNQSDVIRRAIGMLAESEGVEVPMICRVCGQEIPSRNGAGDQHVLTAQ